VRPAILDRWLGIVLMATAGIWSWLVLTTISPNGMPGAPGPRAFPLLLGGLLGLLGLALATASLTRTTPEGQEALPVDRLRRDELVVVGGGFAIFLLYAFLMDKIGFLLATPVVVILALRLLIGIRKWPRILLVSIGLTLGCYVVFGTLMQANLPHGAWFSLG
jgi:putative tricarboxylic transport membrane protein